MKDKSLPAVLLVPAFILLLPVVGMQVSDAWNRDAGSLVSACVLMAGVGFAFRRAARQAAAPDTPAAA